MVLLIAGLYSLTAFFVLFKIRDKNTSHILYIFLIILATTLAVFRIPEESHDYFNYLNGYNNYKTATVEQSFKLIAAIVKNIFDNPIFLFAFYAVCSVLIKSYVFERLSSYPLIVLLAYFAYEYLSQELAQMRVGLSIAFILLALKPLFEKQYKIFFLLGFTAVFFHASAIVFIFLPLVHVFNTKPRQFFLFIICLFIPFFIGPIMSRVLDIFVGTGNYIEKKIVHHTFESMSIFNAFRFATIYRYVIFLFLLYNSQRVIKHNQYFMYEMAVLIYGCLLNSIFFFSSIMSSRLSTMFYSVEVLLFADFMYIFKSKNTAKLIIVLLLSVKFLHALQVLYWDAQI
jgi:hypothetical protein